MTLSRALDTLIQAGAVEATAHPGEYKLTWVGRRLLGERPEAPGRIQEPIGQWLARVWAHAEVCRCDDQ